jgi:hypothetical protein
MTCPEYKLKKYLDRPSPPRAANEIGCRDQVYMGNDGNLWRSISNVNGVYRWVKMADSPKVPKASPKVPKASPKVPKASPKVPKAIPKSSAKGKLKFRKAECLPPNYQWIVGKGCFNV